MRRTPKGLRLHIGIFGRRNVGKSSLLNAVTRQAVSIVSDIAGTTTDPVEKPMELLPIGPVLFIDTAGIDDAGALGTMRVERTRRVLDRTEVGILVTDPAAWGEFEEGLLAEMISRGTRPLVVFNKADQLRVNHQLARFTERHPNGVAVSAITGEGIEELLAELGALLRPVREFLELAIPHGRAAVI